MGKNTRYLSVWIFGFATLLCLSLQPFSKAQNVQETPAQFAKRTAWWRDAKFGMFIHWGIYAIPAQGEWYMNNAHVPRDVYAQYAKQFDPTQFNAAEWVRVAKEAGMKYLVITSKHHDGFCMFRTTATKYNVVDDTPWHHDPLKDLAEQCRKQGVRFCVYYSIMDWHSPDQEPAEDGSGDNLVYNPTRIVPGKLDDYIRYMKTELHELITQYHPGVIWFDGGWPSWWTAEDGKSLYDWLRKQDPSLIINNRVGGAGDYGTPEQTIPGIGPKGLWETCMTINNDWGYNKTDFDFKSAQDLIRKLCDIASKGGNFLLNVGPTAQGIIPQPEVDRLLAMGKWMHTNGQCIYGTTRSPWLRQQFDGRITVKGNDLYLEVFSAPNGDVELHGLKTRVLSATALDGNTRVAFQQDGDKLTVTMPQKLDEYATVIKLTLANKPEVVQEQEVISPNSDGEFVLPASKATLVGNVVQLESLNGPPSVGFWTDPSNTVNWTINVPQAGDYQVRLDYACEDGSQGTVYSVKVLGTDSKVSNIVNGTGSWSDFKTITLDGRLSLPSGKQTICVEPSIMPHGAVMNLRSITLTPLP
jgi:alpha-L-fucosidase